MHRLMIPMLARPFLILAAVTTIAGPLPAAAGETKTVVELFTSQGCSSCPPADKVLGELAKNERVVALSLPVDYWDYLGWRDTLALHAHSMRQKAYADARGDRQVYTPQVVINGVAQAIGSDRRAIISAIATAEATRVPAIPVTLKRNGDKIDIVVGAGTGMKAPVFLLTVTSETAVAIGRGENRGSTVQLLQRSPHLAPAWRMERRGDARLGAAKRNDRIGRRRRRGHRPGRQRRGAGPDPRRGAPLAPLISSTQAQRKTGRREPARRALGD